MGYDYEWVTQPPPNAAFEPFVATFSIPDSSLPPKENNSFFPTGWVAQKVKDLIGEAYVISGCRPNSEWNSQVTDEYGIRIVIQGFADMNHRILTAFPGINS